MSRKIPEKYCWPVKPLNEIKEGDWVPSIIFCDMIRTHNSQMNDWINSGLYPYKNGQNGTRKCKVVKVPSLTKVVTLLRDCGMAEQKIAVLSAEGYSTELFNNKVKKASDKKPGKKPGPRPGSRSSSKPGRRRKDPQPTGASPVRKFITQANKHELSVEKYADIIEDAITEGIVAIV